MEPRRRSPKRRNSSRSLERSDSNFVRAALMETSSVRTYPLRSIAKKKRNRHVLLPRRTPAIIFALVSQETLCYIFRAFVENLTAGAKSPGGDKHVAHQEWAVLGFDCRVGRRHLWNWDLRAVGARGNGDRSQQRHGGDRSAVSWS